MLLEWRPVGEWPHVPHAAEVREARALAQVPVHAPRCRMRRCAVALAQRRISTFQVETAAYACDALRRQGAFLLADSAGAGKTRVIAAVLRELAPARVLYEHTSQPLPSAGPAGRPCSRSRTSRT